jgi:hypothetical protein
MGSQWFVDHPTIPLSDIDLMVCLDLVGTPLGPPGTPPEVRESIFVQGAETSSGTTDFINRLPGVDGIRVRHIPDWLIPPMSDQHAFRTARVPWVFYTVGRDARYHTPADTPQHLDYPKMAAFTTHLQHLTTAADSPGGRRYLPEPAGDTAVLTDLRAVLQPLAELNPDAAQHLGWLDRIEPTLEDGRLPERSRNAIRAVVMDLEQRLGA